MRTLHPPVLPNRRINWDAWVAAGTVVPPRTAQRGTGGLLFVLLVVGLIAGGMASVIWK